MKDVIGMGKDRRVPHERFVPLSDVSRKEEGFFLSAFADDNLDHRGSEDMSGVVKDGFDAVVEFDGCPVIRLLDEREGSLHVFDGVKGDFGMQRRAFLLAVPFLFVGRVFFLDSCRIHENDGDEIGRGRGGQDGAGESLGHDPGDETGMVKMGMRQENRVDAVGRNGEIVPIAFCERAFLIDAAVHEKAKPSGFEERAGSRDLLSGSEKLNFHGLRTLLMKWISVA